MKINFICILLFFKGLYLLVFSPLKTHNFENEPAVAMQAPLKRKNI